MKFGKQIKRLADPAILNHYLAYDVLKKEPGNGESGNPKACPSSGEMLMVPWQIEPLGFVRVLLVIVL